MVSGFTVTRGSASEGGAVLLFNASPILENCVLRDNIGTEGGAIHVMVDSSREIRTARSRTTGPTTTVEPSTATWVRRTCRSASSRATRQASTAAASRSRQAPSARIYDCTFTENQATDGGGVYIAVLTDVPTERDIPEASIVNYCRFFHNTASRGAGLFVNAYSWSLCTYSTFAHNTASDGGGIFVLSDLGPTLSVQYCTIVLNAAEHGGGIFAAGATSSTSRA